MVEVAGCVAAWKKHFLFNDNNFLRKQRLAQWRSRMAKGKCCLLLLPILCLLSGSGCLAAESGGLNPIIPNPVSESQVQDFSHTIKFDTMYYLSGPQQSRPPEGSFKAGIKVRLLQNAGSYSLVRSRDGITAYVVSDSLQRIELNGDNPRPGQLK